MIVEQGLKVISLNGRNVKVQLTGFGRWKGRREAEAVSSNFLLQGYWFDIRNKSYGSRHSRWLFKLTVKPINELNAVLSTVLEEELRKNGEQAGWLLSCYPSASSRPCFASTEKWHTIVSSVTPRKALSIGTLEGHWGSGRGEVQRAPFCSWFLSVFSQHWLFTPAQLSRSSSSFQFAAFLIVPD